VVDHGVCSVVSTSVGGTVVVGAFIGGALSHSVLSTCVAQYCFQSGWCGGGVGVISGQPVPDGYWPQFGDVVRLCP
jgi:hypothetical protein